MEADLAFHVACLYAGKNDFLAPIPHAIRTEMMASLRITNRDPVLNRGVSLPLPRRSSTPSSPVIPRKRLPP